MGFFGKLFDLNHDGKLSTLEKAMDFSAFASIMDDAGIETEMNEIEAELEMADLNVDELEFMDDDERREIMEDSGLDLDDYDF